VTWRCEGLELRRLGTAKAWNFEGLELPRLGAAKAWNCEGLALPRLGAAKAWPADGLAIVTSGDCRLSFGADAHRLGRCGRATGQLPSGQSG
jgi:hypothetical protein